jgi:hypothetical protein
VRALRHPTAKLLKDLGVPARDTQIILGHAHVSTTQQIYTYVDEAAQRVALTRLNELLGGTKWPGYCGQFWWSAVNIKIASRRFAWWS